MILEGIVGLFLMRLIFKIKRQEEKALIITALSVMTSSGEK